MFKENSIPEAQSGKIMSCCLLEREIGIFSIENNISFNNEFIESADVLNWHGGLY